MDFTKEQWDAEKRRRLENDDQFNFKKSPSGGYQGGTCPSCGKKSVWVGAGLVKVQCNHQNSCGWESTVKDLYSDMYRSLCEQFGADPEDPQGKAKIYLQQRGFDLDQMKNWFIQESGYCKSDGRYYPSVRFYLDKANNLYWERFIDCYQKHKANFPKKPYKGLAWIPPGLDLKSCSGHQVWIAEGIFDAISLFQNWVPAIATLSSNNIPDQVLQEYKGLGIEWVVAFDNDYANRKTGKRAGLEAAKRLVQVLEEMGETYKVAFPPTGKDWNDLYRAKKLDPDCLKESLRRGKLFFAKTPEEYGFYKSLEFNGHSVFEFNGRLYGLSTVTSEIEDEDSDRDQTEYDPAIHNVKITKLSTFGLRYLFCLKNARTKKTSYHFLISFPGSKPSYQIELDSSEFGERGPFRKALFRESPGAMFKGDQYWLDIMTEQWFRGKDNVVSILPWNGFDPETKCYVFREVAYDDKGKYYLPNQHGYFDLPNDVKIKTDSEIKMMFSRDLNLDWFNDFVVSFGFKGLVSLSFWTASLFAEHFRMVKKSFPFLAVVGQAGTGKSTLLEFLWRLYGRDENGAGYEGTPLTDASTKVGFYRMMEQVSNLPTVFIEDEEEKKHRKFNYEHFKAAYNGRILRVTGKATQGNETYTPKFRSAIMVGQNAKVEGSQALRERFIELFFDKSGFNQKTMEAAHRIESYQTSDVCGYRHHILSQQERIFPEFISAYEQGYSELFELSQKHKNGPLSNNRVCHTHAVIYGAARILQQVFKQFDENIWAKFLDRLVTLTVNRQTEVSEDTPLVQLFFETLEYLEGNGIELNHAKNNESFVAVNLTQFITVCGKQQIRYFDDVQQLRRELKNSTFYKFLEANKPTRSKQSQTTIKCWIFKKPV